MKNTTPPIHIVKCWPPSFQAMRDGAKKFTARVNDRNYAVGDILKMQEWAPADGFHSALGVFSGREDWYRVTYIMNGHDENKMTGIGKGFCVMSVEPWGKTKRRHGKAKNGN